MGRRTDQFILKKAKGKESEGANKEKLRLYTIILVDQVYKIYWNWAFSTEPMNLSFFILVPHMHMLMRAFPSHPL